LRQGPNLKTTEMSWDQLFRRVMSQFCTGVVIVTSQDDSGPVGLTCQSFASVSIDPPLVLFCPARSSTSWPQIRATGRFCVNVLGESQEALSGKFAVSGGQKFNDVEWAPGSLGAPRLRGAIAHVDCSLEDVVPAGDHEIAIGRVWGLDHLEGEHPLLYFQSHYTSARRSDVNRGAGDRVVQ
jgi:3-hydroxy-9,10-secoandrosta-1,3,5(10)-triene-9,17-dione monooxygenase reductase component